MEIKNPQWLQIEDNESVIYGLNQIWFRSAFKRAAGCGPTVASTLLLYLNKRDDGPLPYQNHDVEAARLTLEDVWKFVTPGIRGLESTEKFVKGFQKLSEHYGTPWRCHQLSVRKNASMDRVVSFIESGLSTDCPVAFLNLHAGESSAFDGWHWIVLTALNQRNNRYIATGYDDGREIEFDLIQWLRSTKKGGGFVYAV